MVEWDWTRVALEAGISTVSGTGGLLFGVWKWGNRTAKQEQKVKTDYESKINAVRSEMIATEKTAEAKNDLLVEQFREAFAGLRRQIDDNKLHTEKEFVRKEDFKDFREEYRQDIRSIQEKLDQGLRRQ